jgi:hypothetical protein
MDAKIRQLERLASQGDDDAIKQLAAANRRMGIFPAAPTVLYNARRRPRATGTLDFPMSTRPNRNIQRFRAHKAGTCKATCRFCRKYGPI